MKLNEDKGHLLGYKHQSIWAKIDDRRIWESNKQSLLGYMKIEHYPLTKMFQIYVKNWSEIVSLSKVVKLYDSNTKESPDELRHWSPVWLMSISLGISW